MAGLHRLDIPSATASMVLPVPGGRAGLDFRCVRRMRALAQGDFELALRGLLDDGAPLSASSIERQRAKWQLSRLRHGEVGDWIISK
jgi:hypothetical protein